MLQMSNSNDLNDLNELNGVFGILVAAGLLVLIGIYMCLIFLYAIILRVIRSFLSEGFKFTGLIMARATHLFLQGPGASFMGVIVRNAAFGGQCKQVLQPHELPEKERPHSEVISGKLNERMADLSRKTAAQAGEALYSALSEGDAVNLKKHIVGRLTDPRLIARTKS